MKDNILKIDAHFKKSDKMDIYDQLLNKMENQDKMDYALFDLNGRNYCPVDGDISLKKFVDDDNAKNFYSIVKKIKVLKKLIKNDGKKAFIEFEIFFQKQDDAKRGPSVICDWVFELNNDGKIALIDSFWDVKKFKEELEKNHPEYILLFFQGKNEEKTK